MKSIFVHVFFSLVLLPAPVLANGDVAAQLSSLIDKHDILILGERHRRVESPELMAQIVDRYTSEGKCLTVALELRSDQQPAIDKMMLNAGPMGDIRINSLIDFPGYRQMLSRFQSLIAEDRCLKVIAIDGHRVGEARDVWMADVVRQHIDEGKVLCLAGNLHAIKKIRWQSGKENPFMAERLVAKGKEVCSVMQIWAGEGSQGVLSRLTIADAANVLNPVAAHVPETASEFGDYVVRWE